MPAAYVPELARLHGLALRRETHAPRKPGMVDECHLDELAMVGHRNFITGHPEADVPQRTAHLLAHGLSICCSL